LRLVGLPYKAKSNDIVKFLKGYGYIESTLKFGRCQDGRVDGTAVVKLASQTDVDQALITLQRKQLMDRWIELAELDDNSYDTYE